MAKWGEERGRKETLEGADPLSRACRNGGGTREKGKRGERGGGFYCFSCCVEGGGGAIGFECTSGVGSCRGLSLSGFHVSLAVLGVNSRRDSFLNPAYHVTAEQSIRKLPRGDCALLGSSGLLERV